MIAALAIILAWLIGSIPFGYLIVRFSKNTDVRDSGSGGTGATNVSRTAGKWAGVLTLILDVLKGYVAVGCAQALTQGPDRGWIGAIAGFAAIVGHCFPVWLRFKGGKGVAAVVGVTLALCPPALAIAIIAIFLPVILLTRFVSLASVCTAAGLPFLLFIFGRTEKYHSSEIAFVAFGTASAILIILMHRANIRRLIAGKESKFR